MIVFVLFLFLICWMCFIMGFYYFDMRNGSKENFYRMIDLTGSCRYLLFYGRFSGQKRVSLFVRDGEIFFSLLCIFEMITYSTAVAIAGDSIRKDCWIYLSCGTIVFDAALWLVYYYYIRFRMKHIHDIWSTGNHQESELLTHCEKAMNALKNQTESCRIVTKCKKSLFGAKYEWYVYVDPAIGNINRILIAEKIKFRYSSRSPIIMIHLPF